MHVEYRYKVTYPIKFQFRSTYFSKSEIFEKVKQYINSTYPNLIDICNADIVNIQNYCCTHTMEINTDFVELPVLLYDHCTTRLHRADYTVYIDIAISCEISTWYSDADTLSQDEQIKIFKTVFSPYFSDVTLTEFDFFAYMDLVRTKGHI